MHTIVSLKWTWWKIVIKLEYKILFDFLIKFTFSFQFSIKKNADVHENKVISLFFLHFYNMSCEYSFGVNEVSDI